MPWHLWKILKVIWGKKRITVQWRCAGGVWIHKEENSKNIDQFRAISLLSAEGKIFFFVSMLYTDDLIITGTKWILQGLEKLITSARMSFKPSKSRSLLLKKGRVLDKFYYMLNGDIIPSITEKPVRILGKIFHPLPSKRPPKTLESG